MKTLTNLNTEKINRVLELTGFNYEIRAEQNEDGTENLTFDSTNDAHRFNRLYRTLKERNQHRNFTTRFYTAH